MYLIGTIYRDPVDGLLYVTMLVKIDRDISLVLEILLLLLVGRLAKYYTMILS